MSSNISVSVSADVSDLQVKRAILSAEMKAATKDLNAFVKEAAVSGATDELKAGMLAAANAAETARVKIAGITSQIKEMTAVAAPAAHETERGFAAISATITETGLKIRETVGIVGEAREAVLAFGEAMIAAFAIERIFEFGKQMGEAAEQTRHVAEEFGFTTAQVQQLQGVATGSGVAIDTLTRGLGIFDKNVATASGSTNAIGKALKLVGVAAGDGKSQMERLITVAEKFNQLPAGPERLALAMALFGRNGREMIPVLDKGAEGIQELIGKSEELGVVNENAQAKAMKLAEATNESNLAWMGLKNTLADAFAPLLTTMTENISSLVDEMHRSYDEGGAVREIFDDIAIAAEGAGKVLSTLGATIALVYDNLNLIIPVAGAVAAVMAGKYAVSMATAIIETTGLRAAITALIAAMAGEGMIATFRAAILAAGSAMQVAAAFAGELTVALLANPWTWVAAAVAGAIAMYEEWTSKTRSQIQATIDLDNANQSLANAEEELTGKSREAIQAMIEEREAALRLAEAHLETAQAALAQASAEAAIAKTELDRDVNSQAAGANSGAAGVASLAFPTIKSIFADHAVDKDKAALADAQTAVDHIKDSIQDMNEALAHAKSGSSGLVDLSATKKPKKEKHKKEESPLQQWRTDLSDMLADEKNWGADSLALSLAFWEQKKGQVKEKSKDWLEIEREINRLRLAEFKQSQGDEVAAIKAMQAIRMEDAKTQIDLTKLTLQERLAAIDEDENAGLISAARAQGARNKLNSQLYQLDLDLENKTFDLKRDTLEAEINLAHQTEEKKKALRLEELTLEKQHDDKIVLLNAQKNNKELADDRKLLEARKQLETTAAQSISQSWAQSLSKMLTLQASFATTVKSLWQGIQQAIANALESILEHWLTQKLTALVAGKAMDEAAGKASIATEVAKAGAGGVASMAAAPFPLNLGAPEFGAAMASAAAAFLSIPSYDVGAWNLPYDQLAMVHAGEMIVPARSASSARDWFSGKGSDGDGGATAGDVHIHIHAMDTQTGHRFLMDNKSSVAKAVQKAVRDGFRG